jgi:hypothetical protein
MLCRRLLIGFALLAVAGCAASSHDTDQLMTGRKNLWHRQAVCGSDPAVSGAAGVYANPDTVYLEDWIVVSVCHLDKLRADADKAQKPITLYIQGIDSGVEPSGVDYDNGVLTFVLRRNEKNKEVWRGLLYAPLKDPTSSMYIGVGIQGEKQLSRAPGANTLLRLHKVYVDSTTWLWGVLLAGVALGLFIVGAKSDLLRDGPTIGGTKQSFSMARTQMAWWFFLVLVGYVFIWVVTGDRDTIPVSLLGLMGISATTALAAVAISSRGTDQTAARKKLLDDELVAIAAANKEIDTQLTDPTLTNIYPTLKAKKADMEKRRQNIYLERASLTTITPSINWWRDLITDDNGAFGLDRVQILVWTVVLGLIFLYSVLWDLSMPEFNNTLLALMGISSGTYIGFKLPSKT